MFSPSQAQSFGEIRIDGQDNTLTINQIIQISADEIKTFPLKASSPYVGLRRFEERNKEVFFGRDRLVAEFVQWIRQRNLLLVAGASGCGKSSLVRAGLLPQLAARLPQGRFRALVMTPDHDPFSSLRAALQGAGVAQGALSALDARSANSIDAVLTEQRPNDELWLLFVDQFEEIFTRCDDPGWRESFLSGLVLLAQKPQRELKIVLAMRADFFDRFGPYPRFAALAQQSIQLVLDMDASDLRAAIEQPAAKHGVVFEDHLVEQIIADVKHRPGALPLLQYTLDLLWREDKPIDDRTLNTTSYHRIGGIEGALRLRADTLYHWTDSRKQIPRAPAQQELMRQLFLRLVDLSSQRTEAPAVSRRAPLADFPRQEEGQLISELVDEKLLITNATLHDVKGETRVSRSVEIAHEALLSAWPLLKEWIEQARQVIYVRNRLLTDSRHYAEAKTNAPTQADDELWAGTRLQEAVELRSRGDFDTVLGGLSAEETNFLNASVLLRANRHQEEEARRRKSQRTRRLAVLGSALAALMVISGLIYGLHEQRLRLTESKIAGENLRQQLLSTYVERGRQLLVNEHNPAEALPWLHRALQRGAIDPRLPDLLKYASWDAGGPRTTLFGHRGPVHCAAFSPDARRIVTASADGTARVWDTDSGRSILVLKGNGIPRNALFSLNARRIVTTSMDGTARVWDADTGRKLLELGGPAAPVESATFSPDGRRIVTAINDTTEKVWDVDSGHFLLEQARQTPDDTRIPGGHRSVKVDADRRGAVLVNADSGSPIQELRGHTHIITSVSFSPDGCCVLTASVDGTARVWNAIDGGPLLVLRGHAAAVLSATFSADGRQILTASHDGTARVWLFMSGHLLREYKEHKSPIQSAMFSPDGHRIVTAGWDGMAQIWDTDSGRPLHQLAVPGQVMAAAFSPEGQRIVTASNVKIAQIWDTETGQVLLPLVDDSELIHTAAFSPDGHRIVTGGEEGTVRIWDADKGLPLKELKGDADSIKSATFRPDGHRILTASLDGTVRIWDADTGLSLLQVKDQSRGLESAAFSPNGHHFVTTGRDGTAGIWDAESGRMLLDLRGHRGIVYAAAFSPKGSRIVTSGEDRTARVWDANSGRLLMVLKGHTGNVLNAQFSPDGHRVVTTSQDRTARLWDIAPDNRSAAEVGLFLRCYGLLQFEREDSDALVPNQPNRSECEPATNAQPAP